MADRLTRWEGQDENGPRAVLAKDGRFPDLLAEALRKLARYEDSEQVVFGIGFFDQEEIHENCTVQILTNSETGQTSVGWWENKEGNE